MAVAVITILALGALAFGAVYPWAYWPLAVASAGIGVFGLTLKGGGRFVPGIATPIILTVAGVGLQLVPLPVATLAKLSPATDGFLATYDVAYALARNPLPEPERLNPGNSRTLVRHPLSIDPQSTWRGLALFISFGLLVLATTRALPVLNLEKLVGSVAALGGVLAVVGIVSRVTYAGKIYGFWTPVNRVAPFGPFVNRNHFAGWMIMALPLVLGCFCAMVARGMRGVKPTFRDRFLWFSTPEANQTLLVAFAILLMGLSLVMTLSRSGIVAFIVAIGIVGASIVRRQPAGARRRVAAAYLIFLAVISIGWAGVDAVGGRFAETPGSELGGRIGAWSDAIDIAKRFPLTGTGLNTYGVATLLYQRHDLKAHYVEAHNDYLQLAAEGGMLLCVPAIGLLIVMAREVQRRFRERLDNVAAYWVRVGAVTGLISIALQEVFEFSLQMPGNAALFAVLCAVAMHKRRPI